MQLSYNFSLAEFTRSQQAARRNIINRPDEQAVRNMRRVAEMLLQPVRDHLHAATGRGLHVTSGYRSPELNAAIGGSQSPISAHTAGRAADVECYAISTASLALAFIDLHINFDKLILEYHDPASQNSGWVHVQMPKPTRDPRRIVLLKDARHNYPRITRQYIVDNYLTAPVHAPASGA